MRKCFVLTDGLLDDLCALEYLASKYDEAFILAVDTEYLTKTNYSSTHISNYVELKLYLKLWFKKCHVVNSYMQLTEEVLKDCDLYLLAPLGEFISIVKKNKGLKNNPCVVMAGDFQGVNGAGKEWNARSDRIAYSRLFECQNLIFQFTKRDCEKLFLQYGYPFNSQFLAEYREKMERIGGDRCCYDLQAVYYGYNMIYFS